MTPRRLKHIRAERDLEIERMRDFRCLALPYIGERLVKKNSERTLYRKIKEYRMPEQVFTLD